MRPGPAALLVCALIVMLPSSASAAGRWVGPETVGPAGTGTAGHLNGRTIGTDASGALDMVWQQSASGTSAFYAARRPTRGSWTSQKLESYATQDASLAVAPNGTAVLAYVDTSTRVVVRWRPSGGVWSAATPISGVTMQAGSPRAGIADDGTATIAWRAGADEQIYAARGTVDAGFGTEQALGSGWLPAVDVAPGGEALVAFRSGYFDIAVSRRGATDLAFAAPVTLGTTLTTTPAGVACESYRQAHGPAVTISSSGRAAVAWTEWCSGSHRPVRAAVRDGGSWAAPVIVGDTGGSTRTQTRAASDDAGTVVVGFQLSGGMRVAELPAGATTWDADELVFSGANDGIPSLDMNAAGHAVFTDGYDVSGGLNADHLAVAYRSADGAWTSRLEDARLCWHAPRAPQGVVDASGNAVFSYGCEVASGTADPHTFRQYAGAYAAPPHVTGVSVPATTEIGQSVTMSAATSGAGAWGDTSGASLSWDFGDGSATKSGTSVTHSYATTGAKTVTISASDGAGSTSSVTRTITVSRPANRPPSAGFSVSPAGAVLTGDSLTLDPSASRDPDADGSLVKFEWDLDGNGTYDQTETTPVAVTHSFSTPGAHRIGLRVTDDRAGTATATRCIEVVSPSGEGPGDGRTAGCDGTVTGGTTPPPPPASTTPAAPSDPPPADKPTPGCGRVVEIGPLQAFAVNCWEREGLTWKTTGRVRLNGIDLIPADGGGNIVIDPLNLRVSSLGIYVVSLSIPNLPPVTIFSGTIAWSFDLGRPSWLPLLPFEIDQKKQQEKEAKDSIQVSSTRATATAAPKVPGFTGCPDPNADPKAPKPAPAPVDPNAKGVATQLNCLIPPKIPLPWLDKLPQIAIPVSASAELVGLKMKGQAGLQLVAGGARLSLSVAVPKEWMFGLVGDTAGRTVVRATMAGGVTVDSLGVDVGETNLFGIKLRDLHIGYDRGRDRWEGALKVELPLPSKPLFGGQMAFEKKRLVALGIHTDGLNKPVFGGVYLQRIDLDVDTSKDFRFKGGVGVTAGPVVLGKAAARIDGDVDIQPRNPFVMVATGNLKLVDQQVADAMIKITSNGTFDFSGNVGWSWGDGGRFGIAAHVEGWVDGGKTFDVAGNGKVVLLGWNAEGQLVVSSVGVGACAQATGIGKIGFGYKWGDRLPSLTGCDLSGFRAPRARMAQAGGEQRLAVPSGESIVAWAIHGRGDAPRVAVSGPGGVELASRADGSPVERDGSLVLTDPDSDVTYVVVGRPRAGEWTVAPQPGSAPLARIETAQGLPAAQARASVSGSGRARTLRWSARRIPGQRVRLYERGEGVDQLLASSTATGGRVRFTPADGPAGAREIIAVVEQDGLVRTQIVAGRYTAPAPAPPAAPRGVRLRRTGEDVTVTWQSARGADAYLVSGTVAGGPLPARRVSDRKLVLADIPAGAEVRATVVAVDGADRQSRAAAGVLRDQGQTTALRVRKGTVSIGVPCPAVNDGDCRGTLALKLGKVPAGSGRFAAEPGATAAVKVRLAPKALRVLKGRRTAKITVRVNLGGGLALEPVQLTVRR